MIIGSIGVAILLVAFFLNLINKLSESSPTYLWANIIGSGMAMYYAWSGDIIPFVILEAAWGGTALVRLIMVMQKKRSA